MTRHDDRITLRQMRDHIAEAQSFLRGRRREDLETDRLLFLALLKTVEIVGEAATRVSETVRNGHPEIPWQDIIDTRHRLIHGYDTVDNDILWHIVTADFRDVDVGLRSAIDALGLE
jgi:uncharacterized protein with HEPN domain